MITKSHTVCFLGIDPKDVQVEVQISPGLPAFNIVGLANKSVVEARERIRAAFLSVGLSLPPKRLTVNLTPADVQKEGNHFDLPIAVALLGALKVIPEDTLDEYICLGELSLDGAINPVKGVLPAALHATLQNKGVICPEQGAQEAKWSNNKNLIGAKNLTSLMNHLKGDQLISLPKIEGGASAFKSSQKDFSEVKGQKFVKRAFEIAAAGGHNLLMIGPPGSGKSMLASRFPTILPDLKPHQALDATMIHSLCGTVPESGLIKTPPFRDPHHTASTVSITGGGQKAKPGEISLAHHGVLFLDELPEFQRSVLESLRQPLESGEILVSRANHHVRYPAKMQLIAAMNPCKCGYMGIAPKQCHKAPVCGTDYQSRLSGPLLDRFDMVVSVAPVNLEKLKQSNRSEESSDHIKSRVVQARYRQENRYKADNIQLNAHLTGKLLDAISIGDEEETLLQKAASQHHLSARSYYRLLKVSQTIADLDNSDKIQRHHILEALSYKQFV